MRLLLVEDEPTAARVLAKGLREQAYAVDLAAELPERFEWEFEFDVPSDGVPVTDSLVVILRAPDGHIAARAAARM